MTYSQRMQQLTAMSYRVSTDHSSLLSFPKTKYKGASKSRTSLWRLLLTVMGLCLLYLGWATEISLAGSQSTSSERTLRVPQSSATPTLDGICNLDVEYDRALKIDFALGNVYLVHSASGFWLCADSLHEPPASATSSWLALYLDRNLSRLNPAQPDDLLLAIYHDGSMQTRAGTGNGTFLLTNEIEGQWVGSYRNTRTGRSAELRLDPAVVGGVDQLFGVALEEDANARTLDNARWPLDLVPIRPTTWGRAVLESNNPLRTFTGQVQKRASDGSLQSAVSVGVALIAGNSRRDQSIVAFSISDAEGKFTLTSRDGYAYHRLELDAKTLPRGHAPILSDQPLTVGTRVDARLIDFADQPLLSASGNHFLLADTSIPNLTDALYAAEVARGPYFLVLAPQAVIKAGALDEFVAFKRGLGFLVEVVSLEKVDQEMLLQANWRFNRIRLFEQQRLAVHGDRFQYLLLVGDNWDAPTVRLGIYLTQPPPVACIDGYMVDFGNWKYSDWFYADLVSNFDSNGNGCYGDGIWTTAIGNLLQPGYQPDTGIQFEPTVAVGRIPFSDPTLVQQALTQSLTVERNPTSYKNKAVLGMSVVALQGFDAFSKSPCSGMWSKCVGYDPKTSFDKAKVGDAMRKDLLAPQGIKTFALYEKVAANAGGSGIQPDYALDNDTLTTALGQHAPGFVNLGGHGSSSSMARIFWKDDTNQSLFYEYHPMFYTKEYGGATLISQSTLDKITLSDPSQLPIYFLNACGTAEPVAGGLHLAARLLQRGKAAGVFAAMSVVTTGSWNGLNDSKISTTNYRVVEAMLSKQWRLGDALWQVLARRIHDDGSRWSGEIALTYFGDPTLTYWGAPGGHASAAPWSMWRKNPFGHGWSNLPGPGEPKELWAQTGSASNAASQLLPSPLLDGQGALYVAHGDQLDILVDGKLAKRLNLQSDAFATPVLASNGLVYVLDKTGRLYAFKQYVPLQGAPQQWMVNLGGTPQTQPVVGADGYVVYARSAGANTHLVMVRPDGFVWKDMIIPGPVIGSFSADVDRTLYYATGDGRILRMNPFSDPVQSPSVLFDGKIPFSTPPLLASNAIYAGRSDGSVVKVSYTGQVQASIALAGAISAGPVLAPGGQLLVGDETGKLYSLTRELGLRWETATNAPIRGALSVSDNAVYLINLDRLRAFHPHSGAALWSKPLGANATGGSTVIGLNRELYLYANNGRIAAFGEGWMHPPILVQTTAYLEKVVTSAQVESRQGMVVQWQLTSVPGATSDSAALRTTQPYTPTHIVVQRSVDSGAWQTVATLPPTSQIYSDTNVLADALYRYRVQLLEESGDHSDFSSSVVAVRSLPELPLPPVLESINALSAQQLQLTWHGAQNNVVSDYRVERALSPSGPFTALLTLGAPMTSTIDIDLTPGMSYHYRIVALNVAGESAPSNTLAGATKTQNLPLPTDFQARRNAAGIVELSWSGAPAGVLALLEHTPGTFAGYLPLATVETGSSYLHLPGDETSDFYRLKFVQGNSESDYVEIGVMVAASDTTSIYLPLVQR